MPCCGERIASRSAGSLLVLAGAGLVGAGLWARRDVTQSLARERIVGTGDMTPPNAQVVSAGAARQLAEVIRERTVSASGGKTYAEVDLYVAADGSTTSDHSLALVDERTGEPVESPAHALWVQSTTFQSALMQAYMAFRLAELTAGLGVGFVVAGAGIAAAGRAARA